MEIRDLLNKYQFPASNTPVIRAALRRPRRQAEGEKAIQELMDAIDSAIPLPTREIDKPFLMCIEDVFNIEGRGTVVTGRVERGELNKMSEVEIVGLKDTRKTVATDIEMFRKLLDKASAGDNVGVLLRGTKKEEVERGMVPGQAGFDHSAHQVQGRGLRSVQGRRWPSYPVLQQLSPAVLLPHLGRYGSCKLPQGVEMVMPGDNVSVEIELIAPVAMEKTQRFAIREGGRTIGAGRISEVVT
jgi:elongation factor Tu